MAPNRPFQSDPVLTAIAVGYKNPESSRIADDVMPRHTVGGEKFGWTEFPIDEAFNTPDARVGRKGRVNQLEFGGKTRTSEVEDYGLDAPVPLPPLAAGSEEDPMKLTFSPSRMDTPLTLEKQGDVLTINGETFDFSPLPDGHSLPRDAIACDWLASDVTRVDGALQLALILPHGPQAPQETLFPVPMILATDGPVNLPPFDAPDVQTEDQS